MNIVEIWNTICPGSFLSLRGQKQKQLQTKTDIYQDLRTMANTVTQQQIDALLDNATTEEHIFHSGKSLIISYQLENGWTVGGRAAIVDLAQFDIEIGRRVARQNAASQLWELEGYLLQNKLADIAKEVEEIISNKKMTDKLAFERELYTKVNPPQLVEQSITERI